MRRILAIIAGLCVVLLAGGFLSLGAFPPKPQQHPVHQAVAVEKLAPPVVEPVLAPVAAPVAAPVPAPATVPATPKPAQP